MSTFFLLTPRHGSYRFFHPRPDLRPHCRLHGAILVAEDHVFAEASDVRSRRNTTTAAMDAALQSLRRLYSSAKFAMHAPAPSNSLQP
jgi:hypothetical protein